MSQIQKTKQIFVIISSCHTPKNHECSYFFYSETPTFFVFFGRFFDGEYGATIKKIKKVVFLGRNSKKLSKKKIFVQGPKLAPKFKSGHLWLQLATKDFRFNCQKYHVDYSSYCYISPWYHFLGYYKPVM